MTTTYDSAVRRSREVTSESLGNHTDSEWLAVIEKYEGRCVGCISEHPAEKDHVIEISRSGCSCVANLQPLCGPCHHAKPIGFDYRPSFSARLAIWRNRDNGRPWINLFRIDGTRILAASQQPQDADYFVDLADYCERNPHVKKQYIAETLLGMSPVRFSKVKAGKKRPSPEERKRIAALLGRSERYVREMEKKIEKEKAQAAS